MSKKPKRQLPLPEQYIAAYEKILSAPAGRNFDLFNFSSIDKQSARNMLNKIAADTPYLRKVGGRYQRTNASGTQAMADIYSGIRSAPQPAAAPKATVSQDSKPQAPKPYQPAKANNPVSDAKAQATKEYKEALLFEMEIARELYKAEEAKPRAYGQPIYTMADAMADARKQIAKHTTPKVVNDLSGGVDADGGYTVNLPNDNTRVALEPFTGLISELRQVSTNQGKQFQMSSISSTAGASTPSEGSSLSAVAADLTYSGGSIDLVKAGNSVAVSRELWEDNSSILSDVANDAAVEIQRLIESNVISGGSILAAASSIGGSSSVADTNVASLAALTLADLRTCMGSHSGSRGNCLVLNPKVFYNAVHDLLDSASIGLLSHNGELSLGGHKIVLSLAMDDGTGGSGACIAIAGSLKQAVTLVTREEVNAKVYQEVLSNTDQVLVHVATRVGLNLDNASAVAKITLT